MPTKLLKRDHAIKRGFIFPLESSPAEGRGWLSFNSGLEDMSDEEIIRALDLLPEITLETGLYTKLPQVFRSKTQTFVIQDSGFFVNETQFAGGHS